MRPLLMMLAVPLVACSNHGGGSADANAAPASGSGTSRSYSVGGFTAVSLRGSDDADVRVGGDFSVRAQGPADMLDDLEISKDGDTLRISRKSNSGFHWGGGRSVKVFVTMPSIAGASLSGSGDMTIDKVTGGSFDGSLSGSGDLAVQHMAVDKASLSTSGSGNVSAAGTAGQVKLDSVGSGDIDAGALTASQADVSTAGSGDLSITVNGPVKASSMGSGDVTVHGNADCSVSKMGSGAINCGH